jgi:hypothetical protein
MKSGVQSGLRWFGGDELLLVIPESLLDCWEGIVPSIQGQPGKDFEQACKVDGVIGAVPVGSGQALVLTGDNITPAAFFEHDGILHVLRWQWATESASEADLVALVRSELASPFVTEPPVPFHHPGGALCLIDAAQPGEDLQTAPVAVEQAAGRYLVKTRLMTKPQAEVLVHRFDHAD